MPEFLQTHIPWLASPWSIWTASAIIAVSAVVLAYGADWTVDSAVAIADRFRISPHVIGLTLVAAGTSAPEFAVSLTAALGDNSDIAISNVVGSNIFNLGFILGGVALVRPLATDAGAVWRDGLVLFLAAVSVWVLFGIDLGVERSNGALLLLGLFGYLALVFARGREPRLEGQKVEPNGARGWRAIARLVVGVLMIATAAELLVEAASSIAASLGVSEWVIGMTIVAAGTSLPEFTTSLVAALRGHHGLGLGNILGSDIFNVLGVLGLTALIQPVTIRPEASGSILALVGMALLTLVFMRSGWRLSRWEGAVLIALGVARWVFDFSQA